MLVTAAHDARYCGLTSPPDCPSNLSFDSFEFLDAFDFLDTFDFLRDLFFLGDWLQKETEGSEP